MYKKKYGRMTVSAWLASEMEQSSIVWMLVIGFVCLLGGWGVRISVGSPYTFLHTLNVLQNLPPVWLMTFLWSVALFTVGCAGGYVLGFHERGRGTEKYRGCLLFFFLMLCELLWYAVFFGAELVFISSLLSVCILCTAVAVTAAFCRVSKFASTILLLHDLWLVYMLILNFSVVFHS